MKKHGSGNDELDWLRRNKNNTIKWLGTIYIHKTCPCLDLQHC